MNTEARAALERLQTFTPPAEGHEELARVAIESLEARKDEDIRAWAERLANDVIDADD